VGLNAWCAWSCSFGDRQAARGRLSLKAKCMHAKPNMATPSCWETIMGMSQQATAPCPLRPPTEQTARLSRCSKQAAYLALTASRYFQVNPSRGLSGQSEVNIRLHGPVMVRCWLTEAVMMSDLDRSPQGKRWRAPAQAILCTRLRPHSKPVLAPLCTHFKPVHHQHFLRYSKSLTRWTFTCTLANSNPNSNLNF
jgi:hypothetical protein